MYLAEEKDAPASEALKPDQFRATGQHQFTGAYLTRRRLRTNVRMFKDKDAQEPWFIATSAPPSLRSAREYAKRWGIEAMFSDFKSRGFGICESQLRVTARIHRLLMVMAIALYWAVSTGLWSEHRQSAKKTT